MIKKKQKDLSIVFIGKLNDPFSEQAAGFLLLHFPEAKIIYSSRSIPFPQDLYEWKGDLLISYLAQWIIPEGVLSNAKMAALNFHPGSPEYPGIGCTNFAIYNEADEFGITCHQMLSKVDSGKIVAVKKFPVFEEDTVYSITQRCYVLILDLFYEIMYTLMKGESLPDCDETWLRKPYIRKQLDELCRLTPDMNQVEMARRIKATNYLKPWAYMQIDDKIFKLSDEKK
ncbi:hypothetical protein BH09BAC2_BH09BAC2_02820 [soil metagenome]